MYSALSHRADGRVSSRVSLRAGLWSAASLFLEDTPDLLPFGGIERHLCKQLEGRPFEELSWPSCKEAPISLRCPN